MSKETLSSRVKSLLAANVHAAVNSLEKLSPQALMEQSLREFDEVIGQARAEFALHEAARHQAARAIARLNNEIETLNEKITTALMVGDEAAARAGAERQVDLDDHLFKLNESLQDAIKKTLTAEADLLDLRAKRDEMEQSLQERIATRTVHGANENVSGDIKVPATEKAERLESEFNRAMSNATGVSNLGASETYADSYQLKRLENLHRERRIAERLMQAKEASYYLFHK